MPESWSEPSAFTSRADDSEVPRRDGSRRGTDPLEQRFDRLMSAGRQLVDGVSGARPGSRSGVRSEPRGDGRRPRLDRLGRWVENKLDWILEEDDDWREPWQEPRPEPRPQASAPVSSRRRPLDAISRRTGPSRPTSSRPGPSSASDPSGWPDDAAFTVPRWQRQPSSTRSGSGDSPSRDLPPAGGAGAGDGSTSGRILPRSRRRR